MSGPEPSNIHYWLDAEIVLTSFRVLEGLFLTAEMATGAISDILSEMVVVPVNAKPRNKVRVRNGSRQLRASLQKWHQTGWIKFKSGWTTSQKRFKTNWFDHLRSIRLTLLPKDLKNFKIKCDGGFLNDSNFKGMDDSAKEDCCNQIYQNTQR